MLKQSAIATKQSRADSLIAWAKFLLPEGRTPSTEAWKLQHNSILVILWLHVAGIFIYSMVIGNSLPHSLFEAGLIIGPAILATPNVLNRDMRAIMASFGLLNASSLLVHLSGGVIEMHFHFFVVIAIISLYQSWKPFLFAIAYVLLEHGVVGVILPTAVYNHMDAWEHPWKWAAIHTGFVLATSVACVINWRVIELARSHTQLILNAAGEGIYGLDNEGRITFINRAALQLLGRAGQNVIGKTAHALFHTATQHAPGDNAQECDICSAQDSMAVDTSGEQLFWRKDGTSFSVEYTRQSLVSPKGVGGAVITFRDITERKENQGALERSEQYYRGLFDNAHDAILIMEPSTEVVLDANQRAFELYGFGKNELIGMSLEAISQNKERGKRFLQEIMIDGKSRFETVHYRKNGSDMALEVNATLIQHDGRPSILSINRDITERKRAEGELHAKETAEAASRAKTEFLSRMSHELRTPLNAILGFGQLLEMEDNTPEQQESVEQIISAGKHLLGLINEVLDISRIEEGKLSLTLEPIAVSEAFTDALSLIQNLASQRSIEIKADLDQLDHLFVYADLQRLKQVLLNILSNAVKYNSRKGAVTITAGYSENSNVCISIFDTGEGISPGKLSRLFTPFDRLGAEQSDVEGTGLGLAVSKGLIEAMGGSIGAISTPGQGSTFWIELPGGLYEAPKALPTPEAEYLDNEDAYKQKGVVLYIEDNVSNIKLVETALMKRPDIRLITSRKALEPQVVMIHNPDLILLDLHLPEKSGHDVLQALQAESFTRDIPVIVVSADATQGQIDQAMAEGAFAYLTKPLDVKQFLRILDEALQATPERVA